MAHTLKKFTEHSDYEEFMENPPVKNTVSICKEEKHVHYDEAPIFYDRLVFDGVAYINTGYVLPENCSVVCRGLGYETVKNKQQVFGNNNGNAATVGCVSLIFGGATSSSNRQIVTYYQTTNYNQDRRLPFSYAEFSFFVTPKGSGNGDFFQTYTKGNLVNSNPFLIGRCSPLETTLTWSSYTGKTRDIRIYGPDAQNVNNYVNFASFTPIATFRPCIYKGEAGMWFVEEGRFCGNAADSGTLTVENI